MPLLGENPSLWPEYIPPEEIDAARIIAAEEQGVDPSMIPPPAIIRRWLDTKSHMLPSGFGPPPGNLSNVVPVHERGVPPSMDVPMPIPSPTTQKARGVLAGRPMAAPKARIMFAGQGTPPEAQRPGSGGFGIQPIEQAARQIQALPGQFRKKMGESQKALTQASENLQSAAMEKADVEAATAEAEAGILRGGIKAFETIQAEQKQKVDKARRNVQSSFVRYQEGMDRLAKMKIDPNRTMSSTGSKIGASIAIMLGAVGAGLAGGRNVGLDTIQKEIDRDIQAQFAAIDKQRGLVSAAQTEVGMARQMFSDEESQKLAAEAAHWQNVQLRIKSMVAGSKKPEILTRADETIAQIGLKQEEVNRQLLERQFQFELQAGTARLGAAQAVVGARGKIAKAQQSQLTPPGLTPIGQSTKDDRKKATAFTANYNRATGALKALVEWRKDHGTEMLDRKAIQKGKALTSRAIIAMKRADDMGANFTEMEKELLGISDDPGEIGFYLERLKTIQESMEREANGFLKPYGYMLTGASYKKKGPKISQ